MPFFAFSCGLRRVTIRCPYDSTASYGFLRLPTASYDLRSLYDFVVVCTFTNFKSRKTVALKLVSHWHANSSRLLREFSRGTFARHSCECRENFHVSRTSRELVAKVLNMFKNWMRFFFPKYFARLSRDCRATVVRRSCECREPVAAKFWRIYNAKFSRHSYERRASVARQS